MRIYISIPFDCNTFVRAHQVVEGYRSFLNEKDKVFVSPFDVAPCVDAPLPHRVSRRIEALLLCDEVLMIKGWENDKICALEREAAIRFGKVVNYEESRHESIS